MTRLILNRVLHPVGIAAGILAAALLALPAHAANDAQPQRLITMTGQGEARAIPDQAQLWAGVVSEGKTAAAALSDNSAKMNAVFAALRDQGIADKDIQTSGFSVSPQYTPYNAKEPRHITGYRVSNRVHVIVSDVKAVGRTLDTLVRAGANQINSVSFSIAHPKRLSTKARKEAVKDATEKAKTFAHEAGVRLGPVQSITQAAGNSGGPRPMMATALVRREAKATPTAPGEQSVTARVTITWQIR
jgi:uncharacterized protein YggE